MSTSQVTFAGDGATVSIDKPATVLAIDAFDMLYIVSGRHSIYRLDVAQAMVHLHSLVTVMYSTESDSQESNKHNNK